MKRTLDQLVCGLNFLKRVEDQNPGPAGVRVKLAKKRRRPEHWTSWCEGLDLLKRGED
jgi:hypothetical protein